MTVKLLTTDAAPGSRRIAATQKTPRIGIVFSIFWLKNTDKAKKDKRKQIIANSNIYLGEFLIIEDLSSFI